mmetsp:Transcript_25815/g.65085  ORF Transcript_25815/g.65085 Transcript_25815/m.65085 type:complete len:327 (-) Transcript_25815:378-1358(-)|eukprot:g17623.t1
MKRSRWGNKNKNKGADAESLEGQPQRLPAATGGDGGDHKEAQNAGGARTEAPAGVATVDACLAYPFSEAAQGNLRNECGEIALRSFVKLPLSNIERDYSCDLKSCLIGGGIYLPGFFPDPRNLVMDRILAEVVAADWDENHDLAAQLEHPPEFRATASANPNLAGGGPGSTTSNPKTKAWSKHQVIENCRDKSVTFSQIIDALERFFDLEILATRLNYYQNQEHWKPFHKDSHAYGAGGKKEDFTVGVSFGAERMLEFVHDDCADFKFGFPQRNGDLFAFTDVVNSKFKHGVPKVPNGEKRGPRISIIGWGRRKCMTRQNGGLPWT